MPVISKNITRLFLNKDNVFYQYLTKTACYKCFYFHKKQEIFLSILLNQEEKISIS